MGKCGTTSLQNFIFPKLAKMKDLKYLSNINYLLGDCYSLGLTEKRLNNIKKILSNYKDILISCEGLVGENLNCWETRADDNLRLFGKEAKIIITLREPYGLMKSMYQQTIHMGNVKSPARYFLNNEEYNSIKKMHCESYSSYFNVDTFDFEKLYEIYKRRFSNVVIVPMNSLKEMKFLKDLYKLDNYQLRILQDIYKDSPYLNISYSQLGMKLTFLREKILNFLGLRSIYKVDLKVDYWLKNRSETINNSININLKPKNNYSFLKRFLLYILRFLQWRYFIQEFVDKLPFIKYKKYNIPENIYLNKKLIKKNQLFLSRFL